MDTPKTHLKQYLFVIFSVTLLLSMTPTSFIGAQEATPTTTETPTLPVETPTATVIDTPTFLPTDIPTETATNVLTDTPSATNTAMPTFTGTETPSSTEPTTPTIALTPDLILTGIETGTTTVTPIGSPTITETSTVTPTTTLEPMLNLIVSDNFDTEYGNQWTGHTGWTTVPTQTGQSLITFSGAEPNRLSSYELTNVAVSAFVQFRSGEAYLRVRESVMGNYSAYIAPTGAVTLYRSDQLVASASVTPNFNYTLHLSAINDVVRVNVDSVEVIAITDGQPLSAGAIAIGGHNLQTDMSVVLFDNVTVSVTNEEFSSLSVVSQPDRSVQRLEPVNMGIDVFGKLQVTSGLGTITYLDSGCLATMDSNGDNPHRVTHSAIIGNCIGAGYYGWSPDGTKLAYEDCIWYPDLFVYACSIYVLDTNSSNPPQLILNLPNNAFASVFNWSPNGLRITYAANSDGDYEIYTLTIYSAPGQFQQNPTPLNHTQNTVFDGAPDWSVNDYIVFASDRATPCCNGFTDIWYFHITTPQSPQRVTFDALSEGGPSWSPDGTDIIFSGNNTSSPQQWGISVAYEITTTSNPVPQLLVGNFGAFSPDWSPDNVGLIFSGTPLGSGNSNIYLYRFSDNTVLPALTSGQFDTFPRLLPNFVFPGNVLTCDTATTDQQIRDIIDDYGVTATNAADVSAWSTTQLRSICNGVVSTGQALALQTILSDTGVQAFRTVLLDTINQKTEIHFIRSGTSANCTTLAGEPFEDPQLMATVTCGTGNVMTEFTATHELGHVFVARTGGRNDYIQGQSGQQSYYRLLTDAEVYDSTPVRPRPVIGQFNDRFGRPDWMRGTNGWGTGARSLLADRPRVGVCDGSAGYDPVLDAPTSFQQNPCQAFDAQINLRETEVEEAAADMFLNWVYRQIQRTEPGGNTGFENLIWINATASNPDDIGLSGDARHQWMQDNLSDIFLAQGW